jgi:hypothetical protein
MPPLPVVPPPFSPGTRYTKERYEANDVNPTGFLWPEEERLVHELIKLQEKALAWTETEKGRFDPAYFDPIMFPAVEHIPWVLRNIPIPPGTHDRIIAIIKDKIASGVYEESNSSYRSRWFCVLKKDGKSLRIVHDLQPLNKVCIQDSALPPLTETFAESFAGRACYGLLDLFVSFDQRELDERSRDMTTFQTPLGTKRLTSVPMGYTNAMQIMHGDVTYVLQDEIPNVTQPFVDDVPAKGPKSTYQLADGTFETISGNPGIRRFVWEHLNNVNRLLQRMKAVGGTFNGKKLEACVPSAIIVGHKCTIDGRVPDDTKVQKIRDWPPCATLTEVRAFLGTCGLIRIFIKDYAKKASPLVQLTKKDRPFEFGTAQQESMDLIKYSVLHAPALRPIDYESELPVYLAVDSSCIAVGFILSQLGSDNRRYYARFGSITWNDRESRYSQAKIELYGLFRALRAYRLYLIGVRRLKVEVDAKYIKGMINNPDVQPNAAMNRWVAGILLFDFELVHVPGSRHTGADGLSRRPRAPEDDEEEDDHDEWIDQAYGFSMELVNWDRLATPASRHPSSSPYLSSTQNGKPSSTPTAICLALLESEDVIPRSDKAQARDRRIEEIKEFLLDPQRKGQSESDFKKLVRAASPFFMLNGQLWRRHPQGRHQLVIPEHKRLDLLKQAHDNLGHKGIFVVRNRLQDRFWWPLLDQDVKWYKQTCHICQERQTRNILVPPTVAMPASLFRKAYVDVMKMPRCQGCTMIIHARCSLSAYPEWQKLRSDNARAVGSFIFEEILCRWGAVEEIVTDNGSGLVAALEYLARQYNIRHIRLSAYNHRANGIVERQHFPVRESLMKAANGDESKWVSVAPHVFWAERVTIQRSTGYSPYRIAHGVEPLFPFDLAEATYMLPPIEGSMSTAELIALRARHLSKRQEDLDAIADRIYAARKQSVDHFLKEHRNAIVDYDFKPGSFVMVRNSSIEESHNRKCKPKWLGPMVVVRRYDRGSYKLAELDGAESKLRYGAFRIIPYYPRFSSSIRLTQLPDLSGTDSYRESDEEGAPSSDDEALDDDIQPVRRTRRRRN